METITSVRTDRPVDGPTTIGRVVHVDGPVVHVAGLPGTVVVDEFVEVGHARLPGEVIAIARERVVAQVYEYTGGLAVGEPVRATGHPLTVRLGPGLLGGIYDGLLRPLDDAGDLLPARRLVRAAPSTHAVRPTVRVGDVVGPGDVLAHVGHADTTSQLLVVPPGVAGRIDAVVAPGDHDDRETIVRIDGAEVALSHEWPVRRRRPVRTQLPATEPFVTGQRVLDVLEPIAKGSSATVIGGFGEGKTMLLEQIAKWGDADVIVYVGCGERGNEMADLIDELSGLDDPRTGRSLLERTIILANTSNMPVMAREASIFTAVTVAEYHRDLGLHAVIIADSTSRWAEARRELSSRTGAVPAEQGYPADLPSSLAAFYQRAGRVVTTGGRRGAVTIVTSVSPPGGDLTEPVSAHTQRFVRAVWALDRELAYARHYPAISWRRSSSRDATGLAHWYAEHGDPDWAVRRRRLQALLDEADRLRGIAELVGVAALPVGERVTLLSARLAQEVALQQSALSERDAHCEPAKQAALVDAVLAVHDAALDVGRRDVPASVIEQTDLGPLIRCKDELEPDDAAGVERVASRVVATIRELAP